MDEYQTISMNLFELCGILVDAGKLPRNKKVKLSISVSGTCQYQSYPLQEVIKFELFEEAMPKHKCRIKNMESLGY